MNKPSISTTLKDFLIHLRLKVNFYLIPTYLYGILLANGNILTLKFLRDFIIIHLFLRGGVNALNDYYDRDEQGPVGGLEKPPPVRGNSLLYLACLWKLIGFYLSMRYSSVNLSIFYVISMLVSVAYSHPSIRLKGSAFWSVTVTALFQGFGIYYCGTILGSRDGNDNLSSVQFWIGGLIMTISTVGGYPLTQVYQIEQDRQQGDRTFAVCLGADQTFQFSLICLLISGLMNAFLFGYYYHWWEGLGSFGYFLLFLYLIRQWQMKFEKQTVLENFKSFHRLMTFHSSCIYVIYLGRILHLF
jgi:1,4-dihydroxy-2-naphthoate octaprenyltransferase